MTNEIFIDLYLAASLGLGSFILYTAKPDIFKALMKDIRLERLIYYVLLIFLGMVCSIKSYACLNGVHGILGDLFFLSVSVVLAFLFSIITNNLADKKIDQISNPDRPTIASTIPKNIIIFFLVFTSLSANFIDLKDTEGDRTAGIKTLPVLTGERLGHRLIGIIFFLTCIAAFWVFTLRGCFWLCLIMGVLQYLLVNRKPYSDRRVMVLHISGLFFIIFYKFLTL